MHSEDKHHCASSQVTHLACWQQFTHQSHMRLCHIDAPVMKGIWKHQLNLLQHHVVHDGHVVIVIVTRLPRVQLQVLVLDIALLAAR